MRYKVGDRVRYIKYAIYHTPTVKENSIWKIIKVDAKNRMYLTVNETNHKEWFKEEELQKVEYTFEDLKKASIGTKIFLEKIKDEPLIKISDNEFKNEIYRYDIRNFKDFNTIGFGKIIKVEEPEYETVYEAKLEILDEVEKRYLRNVISPYLDRIKSIEKFIFSSGRAKITITVKDGNDYWYISLPPFERDTMYKNMEDDKEYTIEELGL